MRIRTVKPEFFTHPVISRLSETAQLLAVGLLCYADDEGYFLADAKLVRSALRPFDDDSLKTHGALTELSGAGFVSIREHSSHGHIGLIENFRKHQVVNRATKSKLKTYYDSRTTHGVLTEDSSQEGKGTGKGTGNGKELPASVPSADQRHSEIVKLWEEAYQGHFGEKYTFNNTRDFLELKKLLVSLPELTPERFIALSKAAWIAAKDPFSKSVKNSFTLTLLCQNYNAIRGELNSKKTTTASKRLIADQFGRES